MKISKINLIDFRRFTNISIEDLPKEARLIVLAGPNGCGKSSLFDAFFLKYRRDSSLGWNTDKRYYFKGDSVDNDVAKGIKIKFHGVDEKFNKGGFYVRTAYRNDPDFSIQSLGRMGAVVDDLPIARMIELDSSVSRNYQRLASQAMEDLIVREAGSTTIGEFRDRFVGEIREPLRRLFPDLIFVGLGNPLAEGTFKFEKGSVKNFDYKNLSGGEKSAFDLLLDLVVRRRSYSNAVYCIDEPEAHMNTKLQGSLLQELYQLIPEESQLWISTHSIGMMRKARELYDREPGKIVFLDFGGHDFDRLTKITPSVPTRGFWEKILDVALDDLASLIAPSEVVVCEGNPVSLIQSKNNEHDAIVYGKIFGKEFYDVKFISGGSSKEVANDRLGFVATLPKIAPGIKIRRLIDRDDHAEEDIAEFLSKGISVLSRRHLEAYLYDNEVLQRLCEFFEKAGELEKIVDAKNKAIAASVGRGNCVDDVKSAAPEIYVSIKKILGVTGVGDNQLAFCRNTLAPLIGPEMSVYQELRRDIFGVE